MKDIWKKYGIIIELVILFTVIGLMVYYQFWNDESSKLFIRWFQFILFLGYFIDRLIKLSNRLKNTE
jgi:hypothetical protein